MEITMASYALQMPPRVAHASRLGQNEKRRAKVNEYNGRLNQHQWKTTGTICISQLSKILKIIELRLNESLISMIMLLIVTIQLQSLRPHVIL